MTKIYGWSPTEMREREDAFAALVDTAVTRITKKMSARLTEDRVVVAAGAPPVEPVPTPPIDLGSVAAITAMWNGVVSAELMPALTETYLTSASAVYQGASYAFPDFMIPPVSDVFAEDYLAAATNRLVGIGDYVWQQVRSELLVGFSLGESVAKLRDRVVTAGNVSQARANVIARTEVLAASNAGAQQQVMISGLVGTKEWLDTNDTRTRCTHKMAGGQTVAIDQPFRLGGPECKTGYSFLMQPGDPTAPPGEIIQCRCSVAYDLSLPEGEEDPLAGLEVSVSGNVGALTAAAEVHTGAMIALVPNEDDATQLALDGYEPANELHVTMSYLGNAADWLPEQRQVIKDIVANIAATYAPVVTETFSVNIFNPTSDDTDTAIVLGVGGNHTKLSALHDAVTTQVEEAYRTYLPEQHTPWVPHITLAYTDDMRVVGEAMTRLGTIAFNRLRCAFGSEVTDYPLDGVIVAAGKSIWKEAEHPRDHKGQFAKKPGSGLLDTLLDLVTGKKLPDGAIVATWNADGSKHRLRVTADEEGNPGVALQEIMGGKWENVSSTYAHDKKTIQSWLDDAHAGKNLTLSPHLEEKKSTSLKTKTLDHAAIWRNLENGEYRDEQVIATGTVNGGIEIRLVAHVSPSSGKLSITEEYKKPGDKSWKEEDTWTSQTDFLNGADLTGYTPTPDVTSTKKDPSTVAVAIAKGDFSGLKKIGGQKGSNEGGLYEASDGSRWYVKVQKDAPHAENEKLAADLYRAAGIDAPEIHIGGNAPGLSGGVQTASRIVEADPGKSLVKVSDGDDPALLAAVREGFAMDVLLANWDVAGLSFDNVIFDKDGKPHRIDVGGALLYRAKGAPKGSAFGTDATEWETLRDAKKNSTSAKLFKGMTSDELSASVARVEALTPEKIKEIVKDKKLADKLIARRESVLEKAHADGLLSSPKLHPGTHPVDDHIPSFDTSPEAAKLGITDEELAALQAKIEIGHDAPSAPDAGVYGETSPNSNGFIDEAKISVPESPTTVWNNLIGDEYVDGEVVAIGTGKSLGNTDAPLRIVAVKSYDGSFFLREEEYFDGAWGKGRTWHTSGEFDAADLSEYEKFTTPKSTATTSAPKSKLLVGPLVNGDALKIWKQGEKGIFADGDVVAGYEDSSSGDHHHLVAKITPKGETIFHDQILGADGDWFTVETYLSEDEFTKYDLTDFGIEPGKNAPAAKLGGTPYIKNPDAFWDDVQESDFADGAVLAEFTDPVHKSHRLIVKKNLAGEPYLVKEWQSTSGTWYHEATYSTKEHFLNGNIKGFGFDPPSATPSVATSSPTAPENTHLGLWQKVASGGFGSKELVGSYIDEQGWVHELRAGVSGATPGVLHTKTKPGVPNPIIVEVAASEEDLLAMDLSKFKKPYTGPALKQVPSLTNAIIYGKYKDGDVIATYDGSGMRDMQMRLVYQDGKIVKQAKTPGTDKWMKVESHGKGEAYKHYQMFTGPWLLGDKEATVGEQLVTTPAVKKVAPPPPPPAPTVTPVTWAQKSSIKGVFFKNGVKWHTASATMLDAAVEAQKKHPELSLGQILQVMDGTTKTQTSPTPFTDKIKKYLSTKSGKSYAKYGLGLFTDAMTKIGVTSGTPNPGTSNPTVVVDHGKLYTPTSHDHLVPITGHVPTPAGHGIYEPGTHTYLAPPGGYKKHTPSEMTALQKQMAAIHGDWPTGVRDSLRYYTTSAGASAMNNCLRTPSTCSPATLKHIQRASDGMHPLPIGVRVVRGTGNGAFPGAKEVQKAKGTAAMIEYMQAQEGRLMREPGFLSTSVGSGFGGSLRWTIDIPPGAPAAWVKNISHYGNEEELLLPPGIKYRIKKVEPGSGQTHITLEVIYP